MSDLLLLSESSNTEESFSIDLNLSSLCSSTRSSQLNESFQSDEQKESDVKINVRIPSQSSDSPIPDDRNSSSHHAQRGSSPPRIEEYENVIIYPELVGFYDVKKMIGEGMINYLCPLLSMNSFFRNV